MAVKKSTTKVTVPNKKIVNKTQLYKEIKFLEPNWENIPIGSKFKGTIFGEECEGIITKERNSIFLLQNIKLGSSGCKNNYGYKYAWWVNTGSLRDLVQNSVVITEITLNPKFKPLKSITIDNRQVSFQEEFIYVGCTKVSNETVKEIFKRLID